MIIIKKHQLFIYFIIIITVFIVGFFLYQTYNTEEETTEPKVQFQQFSDFAYIIRHQTHQYLKSDIVVKFTLLLSNDQEENSIKLNYFNTDNDPINDFINKVNIYPNTLKNSNLKIYDFLVKMNNELALATINTVNISINNQNIDLGFGNLVLEKITSTNQLRINSFIGYGGDGFLFTKSSQGEFQSEDVRINFEISNDTLRSFTIKNIEIISSSNVKLDIKNQSSILGIELLPHETMTVYVTGHYEGLMQSYFQLKVIYEINGVEKVDYGYLITFRPIITLDVARTIEGGLIND